MFPVIAGAPSKRSQLARREYSAPVPQDVTPLPCRTLPAGVTFSERRFCIASVPQ
jgi:hypothetical protein